MKFKQLTYFRKPSFVIEESEYGSPIRFDNWCLNETERIPNSVVISKIYQTGKSNIVKVAIFAEV